jgi:threonine/homoserine/homoserine lactone efflux protein
MRESLTVSRASAISLSLGLALGGFLNQTFMIIGFGLLVSQSPQILHGLKIIGAIYLAHLGLEALGLNTLTWMRQLTPRGKSAPHDYDSLQSVIHRKEKSPPPSRRFFPQVGRGILLNMSNPSSILFFLSIYSAAVSDATPSLLKMGYASALSLMDFSVFSGIALVFSASSIQSFFFAWQGFIEKLTGITLLCFAVSLFWGC